MAYFKSICLLICYLCSLTLLSQSKIDKVLIKINHLKTLLNQADTLRPDELFGYNTEDSTAIDINAKIMTSLSEILTMPSLVNYNIDSLLVHDFLAIAHSKDERLWIFSWSENTGGSLKSNINLIYYKTKFNKSKIDSDIGSLQEAKVPFCADGINFKSIHKLNVPLRNLYLCLGSITGCSTCHAEVATVIELTKDNINLDYPAFIDREQSHLKTGVKKLSPCFYINSRFGDIERFEFDPINETLYYTYLTDDNTPITIDKEGIQKKIIGQLTFNKKYFIETHEELKK